MIEEFKGVEYEERLSRLHLSTLETQRLRGDLIHTFKMMKGLALANREEIFTEAPGNLRGHDFKLFKSRFCTDLGKFSFGNRIVSNWNLLPEEVISSGSVNQFKNKLDDYFRKRRGVI